MKPFILALIVFYTFIGQAVALEKECWKVLDSITKFVQSERALQDHHKALCESDGSFAKVSAETRDAGKIPQSLVLQTPNQTGRTIINAIYNNQRITPIMAQLLIENACLKINPNADQIPIFGDTAEIQKSLDAPQIRLRNAYIKVLSE